MKNILKKTHEFINQLSFGPFATIFIAIETLVAFIYSNCLNTYEIYGSRENTLIGIVTVFGAFGLLYCWKHSKSLLDVFVSVLFPLLLYEAVQFWYYMDQTHLVMFVAFGVVLLVSVLLALWKGVHPKDTVRKSNRIKKMVPIAYRSLFAILLCYCVYGKYAVNSHVRVYTEENVAYDSTDPSETETATYTDTLESNIEKIAKLDPTQNWEDLSMDEVVDVLETVIRIECNYLGMGDSYPTLEIAYFEEGLLGTYNPETDVITISNNYIVDSKGYWVVQVLCHEIYHRYQHRIVDLLNKVSDLEDSEKYANLLLLEKASKYKEESENYISPDGSAESYVLYAEQDMEEDADRYGYACENEYYEAVQEYLGLEPGY